MQPIEYHLKVLAGSPAYAGAAPTMEKAADKIEGLRRQLAEAREVLLEVLDELVEADPMAAHRVRNRHEAVITAARRGVKP